jgi:RNA polymerase sigma factor (sigma-70 family)
MRPISTEELVAYFAKKLPSDRAQAIEDLWKRDVEMAARLGLIQATAGYCREDVISAESPAAAPDVSATHHSSASVTNLIGRVKEGDPTAARDLMARYFQRLLGLARAKLHGKNLHVADEEDVVQSVFAGFFLSAERGQYAELRDRDDLWHLLCKITVRKAQKFVMEQERQKRSPGTDQRGTPLPRSADTPPKEEAIDQVADPQPSPDAKALANETIERLLGRLKGPQLRSIAVWKWEGYTTEEIAAMLGCSPRTIQRKLRLIRAIWIEEE